MSIVTDRTATAGSEVKAVRASCLAFSTSAARCLSARAACPEGWLISYLTLPALVLVAA